MEKVGILYELFKNRIPFCFSKMNDGEVAAMVHVGAVISRGDDVSTPLMRDKLIESLNYDGKNYYCGLPCSHCRRGDYDNVLKLIEDKTRIDKFIFNANILINSNVWTTFEVLKNNCGGRRIVVVSNEGNLRNIGKLERFNIRPYKLIEVADRNAFETDFERIKDEWRGFENGDLVICLCGPLGRVLCYEWFKANPTLTCLELGSLFDPFLKNRTYAYHTQNHGICNGCFPVTNISDEQRTFMDSLIEDPNIQNECYYSYNNETLDFYLSMFGWNLDRMRSNVLIRIKKHPYDKFMKYLLSYIECVRLQEHIVSKGHNITEGHCFQNQKMTRFMVDLILDVNPRRVLEIGFNAGHSSLLFLMNSGAEVYSFDTLNHLYAGIGKDYIDKKFPGRHTIIRGDSKDTLVEFGKVFDEKFDLFFVDGEKTNEVVYSDLVNCFKMASKNAMVLINDTILTKKEFMMFWNNGPTNVWEEMLESGMIKEEGTEDYERGKGMSWGRFNVEYKLDNTFLRYKRMTRGELFKNIEKVYYEKNYELTDKLTSFYLDVFKNVKNTDLRMVKFFRGYSVSNVEEKMAIYEELLRDVELEDYLRNWTSYNLSVLYPGNSNPIPKIIHFIYLKQRDFQKYHLRCISSASHFCPDYQIWVHNDIEPVGNEHWDNMKKLPNVVLKKIRRRKTFDDFPLKFVQYEADVLRLELLYNHGGIYLDTDMYIVKNFDEIINSGKSLYISEETENGGLINSFLASKVGNEFLRIWLDSFRCGLRMDNWAYHIRESNAILLRENPHYKIKYGVERLSYIHFFPFSWTDRGAFDGSREIVLDERTYGVHLFDTILHDVLNSNSFMKNYYNI